MATVNQTVKRFIAGARCPNCQKMDTTVSYFEKDIGQHNAAEHHIMVRECTECDFIEKMYPENVDAGSNGAIQQINVKEVL
ncbi:MAG: YheV family putative metal-binding protein [Kangiellaceae bacterium]|nr:YheV family putative metal-binding protein [Kangiellaceae bacterium]